MSRRADLVTFRKYVAEKEQALGPLASPPSSRPATLPASEGNVFYLDARRAPRHPYKVRLACGHVVLWRVREATAAVPWTEDVLLESAGECFACSAHK